MPIFGTRTRAPGLDANLDSWPFEDTGAPSPAAANDDVTPKPAAITPDNESMTPGERAYAAAQGLADRARNVDRAMRLVAGTGLSKAGPVNPADGSPWGYEGRSLADLRQERDLLEQAVHAVLVQSAAEQPWALNSGHDQPSARTNDPSSRQPNGAAPSELKLGGLFGKRSPECQVYHAKCLVKCSERALPTRDYGVSFQRCVNECMASYDCL